MESIHDLDNQALKSRLVTLALDVTFINPQWGVWSLSNDELLRDEKFHREIDELATLTGISVSGLSLYETAQKAWKSKKFGVKISATLVIWGVVAVNKQELNQLNLEIRRRTKSELRTSNYH